MEGVDLNDSSILCEPPHIVHERVKDHTVSLDEEWSGSETDDAEEDDVLRCIIEEQDHPANKKKDADHDEGIDVVIRGAQEGDQSIDFEKKVVKLNKKIKDMKKKLRTKQQRIRRLRKKSNHSRMLFKLLEKRS